MHQVQTHAYISQHFTPSHGYASPYATTPGGVMVDPEERFRTTHTTYVVPASAAQPLPAAASDAFLTRLGNLEEAFRQAKGTDHQSYQFRDLCLFLEATLPAKFRIPKFEKYNGRGCPISHLKAYCGDLPQLWHDDRLLIRLLQKSLTGPGSSGSLPLTWPRCRLGTTFPRLSFGNILSILT